MKNFIALLSLIFFSYLICINSTENRQSLTDDQENISYVNFSKSYIDKTGDSNSYTMIRCYTVYQGLINMKPVYYADDEIIKQKLLQMGFCELDEGKLVLKGFHIEDNLRALVGSSRRLGKK